MRDRVTGWLINTCLLGCIPLIARLFVWTFSTEGISAIAVPDLVAFGLVVQSSNITTLNAIDGRGSSWKTVNSGIAIVFIFLFGLAMFTTIGSSKVDNIALLKSVEALCVASFVLGLAVTAGSKTGASSTQ